MYLVRLDRNHSHESVDQSRRSRSVVSLAHPSSSEVLLPTNNFCQVTWPQAPVSKKLAWSQNTSAIMSYRLSGNNEDVARPTGKRDSTQKTQSPAVLVQPPSRSRLSLAACLQSSHRTGQWPRRLRAARLGNGVLSKQRLPTVKLEEMILPLFSARL